MNPNVIKRNLVSESFHRLRERRTHTLFGGYLCLQMQTAVLGRRNDLRPDFRSFYQEFFSVKDHPLGAPYIKPFIEQKSSSKNLWLNGNVAGSYAPSSLRPGQPFRKVVNIEKKEYSLPTDHASKALQHLLFSNRIPVADLAIFLYRDFGFIGKIFTVRHLINVFAYEFGYSEKPDSITNSDFDCLYDLHYDAALDVDWLESNGEI